MKHFTRSIFTAVIFITLVSCSQNKKLRTHLRGVDGLEIQFFDKSDTLTKKTADEGDINLLMDQIASDDEQETLSDTTGRIQFMKKGSVLLEVYFTLPFYTYHMGQEMHGGRFTYRGGRFLDELYSELKSKKQ